MNIHVHEAQEATIKMYSRKSILRHIIIILSKDKENSESSKRNVICHVQGESL